MRTYILIDTFNDREISRHKTLDAAAKAHVKHSRDVRKHNGQNSYIPKKVIDENGTDVTRTDDYEAAMFAAEYPHPR